LDLIENTINSLKITSNIILKNDGVVIQNIEQFLKYRYSVDLLSFILTYIRDNEIFIKDFSYWYMTDTYNPSSKDMIKFLNSEYYK
jgi:hypothetical protein